jgi:hypothetical protein
MDPRIGKSNTLYISTKRTRSIYTTNFSSRPEKGFASPQHQGQTPGKKEMDPRIGKSNTLYISTKRTRSIHTTNFSSRPEKGFAAPPSDSQGVQQVVHPTP